MIKKLEYDFEQVGDQTKKALVAIHGWQGSRNSMKPLMRSMNLENIGWYFLEAPYQVEGLNNSFSWSYEISEGIWEENEPKDLLNNFFHTLFKKYSSEKVYVLGFSQGGLVCIDFVLFLNQTLGGIFPIAGFSRYPKKEKPRFHLSQKNTPILISHGRKDKQVPVRASKIIYNQLKKQGANVELFLYNGIHKIGVECLRKIKIIVQN